MTRDPFTTTMHYTMVAAVAVSILALGGCGERKYNRFLDSRETITLNAGDAVAYNKAVQTINPWPAHSRNASHASDGKRILLGMKRYQKNESLEPQGTGVSDKFEGNGAPPPAAPPAP